MEGFLIGSVVGSTDAASVFATLRSKKLNLKGSLASLLEIESGSNDPIAYTMTLITLSIMSNSESVNIPVLVIKQIIFGLLVGVLIAKLTIIIIREIKFEIKSFYTIFILTITILVYSFSDWIGGNGYLSVYIAGIIIGNSKIPHKKSTFHFFDGLTWIMQIALFFILGLLSFPSKIKDVLLISILISVFMILVARPIATFLILGRFKFSIKEKMFVSWVGLRGAASIVFAIFAITYGINIKLDIFHIVFFVALISVGLQGTLIPWVAKKLDLVDNNTTVLKTFNDYTSDKSTVLVEYPITNKSRIVNKTIMDSDIPEDILIVMIKRKGEVIVPKGSTVVLEGDTLVLTGNDKEFLLKIVNS